jgi:sodium/potassium/calcium exchanger 6
VSRAVELVIGWGEKGRVSRALAILTAPFAVALWLTIPHVDPDSWSRPLASTSLAAGILAAPILFGEWIDFSIATKIALIVGAAAAGIANQYISPRKRPPRHRALLVTVAFALSVAWIYAVANELVAMLSAVGAVLHISNAILGLTILAWGNSVGDFVANCTVSRQGYPEMAMAAAYAGPFFNLAFGFGLALSISNVADYPKPYPLHMNGKTKVVVVGLLATLVASLLIFRCVTSFRLTRWHSFALIVGTVVTTGVCVLLEVLRL